MIQKIDTFLKGLNPKGTYAICKLDDFPNRQCYDIHVNGVDNFGDTIDFLKTNGIVEFDLDDYGWDNTIKEPTYSFYHIHDRDGSECVSCFIIGVII